MNSIKYLALSVALAFTGQVLADGADGLSRVKVDLLAPPQVHAHQQVAPQEPRVVQFRLVVEEKKGSSRTLGEERVDSQGSR